MKKICLTVCIVTCLLACNNSEQAASGDTGNTAGGNYSDTVSDTRGMRGTGSDNNGGTPGPGTVTDTFKGKTDTADHTSKKTKLPAGK